ncbi:MAG: ABC transporter ATP-binding protein, partial [Gammaproteobacteria bacterium]|nr:ABC transporter ATP-binding protein [Gammaproteobacteria bacterium]
MSDIDTLAWPASRLGEAFEILARKRKLVAKTNAPPISVPDFDTTNGHVLDSWIDLMVRQLDIEAETVTTSYAGIDQFLRNAHPAVIRLPRSDDNDESHFLLLYKGGWWGMSFIDPDLKVHRKSREQVRDALCDRVEKPIADHIDAFWTDLGIPEHQRNRTQKPLTQEILLQTGVGDTVEVCQAWLLRPRPGTPLRYQARHKNIIRPFLIAFGAIILWQILEFSSWGIIGLAAFQGHVDWAWFMAWGLALFTIVVCKLVLYDHQFRLFTDFMKMFKTKLLYGTLRFKPDEIRYQGTGQFLSRVMDSEMVESVSLFEGITIVTQLVILTLVGIVLIFGVGGWWHTLLLLGWVGLTSFFCWRYLQVGREWMRVYRGMSQDLVERMIGHRTRLVQENPKHWHDDEDKSLERYLQLSAPINRIEMLLVAFIPRGWVFVRVAALAFPVVNDTPP